MASRQKMLDNQYKRLGIGEKMETKSRSRRNRRRNYVKEFKEAQQNG